LIYGEMKWELFSCIKGVIHHWFSVRTAILSDE